MNEDLLLARNSLVDWGEEKLLVIANCKSGLVTMADKAYSLNILRVVIENILGNKVVVPCCFWIKLKTNSIKALANTARAFLF